MKPRERLTAIERAVRHDVRNLTFQRCIVYQRLLVASVQRLTVHERSWPDRQN